MIRRVRAALRGCAVALSIVVVVSGVGLAPAAAATAGAGGPGNVPQGIQSNATYAASFAARNVRNVFATTQRTSCYRPEVPYFANNGPAEGYSGMSDCAGAANTGENVGLTPYATQAGSNPGYPAAGPMLVKDHSESDLQVDPTNPSHLIGSSKWIVSAEGYNHLLGFYESFDGGQTWPVQGHIPGYEGWTDNTDPVGAFDGFGNYYSLLLPYQFFYNADGSKNYTVGTVLEPNPTVPAEVISIAVRPHGATSAQQWITTYNGHPDYVATYDSVGREPDKQWITIDTNPASPFYNTIYAMWTLFTGLGSSRPYVSTAKALPDGTHTPWSAPLLLPTLNATAADTYLLPHVDPSGVVYTTVSNFPAKKQYTYAAIAVIYSTDAGKTWQGPFTVAQNIIQPPGIYPNTTFRSGILNTFTVGRGLSAQGRYPLYVAWEDYSAGVTNILLSASYDGGATWSSPIQVNDNASAVDEFQPNLAAAPNGAISVAFYDRRLACPAAGTAEAAGAGLALDTANPSYSSLPPYGASNYCINASIQFYSPTLQPLSQNIRLTAHTWDPQLSAPHPDCATCRRTFIGDYFGNTFAAGNSFSTFVSTFNDGTNPAHHQQQVIAILNAP